MIHHSVINYDGQIWSNYGDDNNCHDDDNNEYGEVDDDHDNDFDEDVCENQ